MAALVDVTFEINVLTDLDEFIVLELSMATEEGGPGTACGTVVEAGGDELLTFEFEKCDEETASKLLDVVALTRVDEEIQGNMRLLLNAEDDAKLALLDVARVRPAEGEGKTLVLLLLEVVFCGTGKLLNAGVGGAVPLAGFDMKEDNLLKLDALSEPLDAAVVELKPDIGIRVGKKLPSEVPVEDAAVDNEVLDMDNVDGPPGISVGDVDGGEDREIRLFDEASDDLSRVKADEEGHDVVATDGDSVVDGRGATVNHVDSAFGTGLNGVLEKEALGDDVAVTTIVWSEVMRVNVVVLPLGRSLVSGSGNEIVNLPLDDRAAELVLVAESPFETGDIDGVRVDVALPTVEVTVLVDVVS
ncbi:hypothetical protein E8E12_003887 [Didymella heteroderae]|uniref:Uncharacterized protein n=1 Tax=Didymella heteroderae TaxID=1769908 RepID=A0A9P5BYX7_9PLEO|nr:hypothetical protein E8E12_003887 [Didymella heteroderae]